MSREYRQVRPGFLEVRAAPDGASGRIIADVMKYNVVDDYRTAFEPRCFSESLETRMPRILWSHNPNDPIGQWVDADDKPDRLRLAGALDLAMIDGTMTPAVPSAHRAFAQLRSRTIDQFSVGFVRQGEIRNKLRQGVTSITKAQLDEASPVLVGSVPGAELVSVRSANPDLLLFGRQRRLTFFPSEIRSPALDAEREERVAGGQFAKGGGRVPGSAKAGSGPVVPKASKAAYAAGLAKTARADAKKEKAGLVDWGKEKARRGHMDTQRLKAAAARSEKITFADGSKGPSKGEVVRRARKSLKSKDAVRGFDDQIAGRQGTKRPDDKYDDYDFGRSVAYKAVHHPVDAYHDLPISMQPEKYPHGSA